MSEPARPLRHLFGAGEIRKRRYSATARNEREKKTRTRGRRSAMQQRGEDLLLRCTFHGDGHAGNCDDATPVPSAASPILVQGNIRINPTCAIIATW
jgi:hypothetical protein